VQPPLSSHTIDRLNAFYLSINGDVSHLYAKGYPSVYMDIATSEKKANNNRRAMGAFPWLVAQNLGSAPECNSRPVVVVVSIRMVRGVVELGVHTAIMRVLRKDRHWGIE
jgi:hypothetical protein